MYTVSISSQKFLLYTSILNLVGLKQIPTAIDFRYIKSQLKNKYLKAMILAASDQESSIHPVHKIMDEQRP